MDHDQFLTMFALVLLNREEGKEIVIREDEIDRVEAELEAELALDPDQVPVIVHELLDDKRCMVVKMMPHREGMEYQAKLDREGKPSENSEKRR